MSYYNTAPPTPSTKNSITKTATDYGLRDFLLHKNIQNPIRYPQLSTSINGAPRGGEPFLDTMVGTGVIIAHNPLTVDGVPRYESAILMNQYKDTDSAAPIFLNIENETKIPIFIDTTAPSGIADYQQVDKTLYGILPKSNEKNFRKLSTIKNLYVDASKQIDMADFISLQPQQTAQQLTSYLDEYGNLNLGDGASTQPIDLVGSLLNGQGIGLARGGIVDNYDIRASLAGRVLTATGLLNDTKLGVIGGQQLALALANNAAFNTQQSILGTLNAQDNILSLVKDGNLAGFRPNYKITVPKTTGGRILDTAEKILGFTIPKSYLSEDASLFSSENGNITNIDRANAMILNTGKGQVKALISNFVTNLNGISPENYDSPKYSPFRSGYAPGYKDNRGQKAINPSGYVFMDDDGLIDNLLFISKLKPIPELSYNRTNMIDAYGFTGTDDVYGQYGRNNINQPTFSWGGFNEVNAVVNAPYNDNAPEPIFKDKKTLLGKTQTLFNSKGMKTIVSRKGAPEEPSQIQTGIVNGLMSKGSAVMQGSMFDKNGNLTGTDNQPENVFCRSWTTYHRYDTVNRLIRNSGLNQNEDGSPILRLGDRNGGWRQNIEGSVLDSNGFVKITPYKGEDLSKSATSPKKYMFSIENLAWVGTPATNLLPCEQGPGDLLSGKFGRIMWFPPYDLTFSETSNMNIESTNFIGRGEPIYTYNNTERTGNLSFKLIVDHPSVMNAFAGSNGPEDEFIRSWFAGCVNLDGLWGDKLTPDEKNKIEATVTPEQIPQEDIKELAKVDFSFAIYFKNDRIDVDPVYESQPAGTLVTGGENSIALEYRRISTGSTQCTKLKTPYTHFWEYGTSWGLNQKPYLTNKAYADGPIKFGDKEFDSWTDANFKSELKKFLDGADFVNRKIKITIVGSASKQGCTKQNEILALGRANNTKAWLESFLLPTTASTIEISVRSDGEVGKESVNSSTQTQLDYKVARSALITITSDPVPTNNGNQTVSKKTPVNPATTTLNSEIKKRFYTECDFFERLGNDKEFVFDKIREKIKYFHPAFHSVTPEGFNSRLTFLLQCTRQGPTIKEAEAKNLAFGTPPVCILRIGDFYNTKIMIDNISFDFDEQTWDLNPEGIGVQPMIARVNMSFKYIGGSSLYGPINKLQNALSFNYFANTHVYDVRADYITASKDSNNSVIQTPPDQDNSLTKDLLTQTRQLTQYELKTGMDLTKDNMNKISSNQVVSSNLVVKNSTPQTILADDANTPTLPPQPITQKDDLQRIQIVASPTYNATDKKINFGVERITKTDTTALSTNYQLRVIVTNQTKNEVYDFTLTNELIATDANTQLFSFDVTDFISKNTTTDSYELSVVFIKLGRNPKNKALITKKRNIIL